MKLLMFPGQGSQFLGMGREWHDQFREAQEAFEEASDHSGLDLKTLCFESSEDELKKTEFTQPAILTTSVAIFRALKERIPMGGKSFCGHSLGEYSALVCAGVMPLGAAATLVHHRGKYMQEAVAAGTGGMSAVLFRDVSDAWFRVDQLCQSIRQQGLGQVWPANDNAHDQVVVAGDLAGLEAIEAQAPQVLESRRVLRLPVSAPFHCPLMQKAAEALWSELERVSYSAQADLQYIANVDAQVYSLEGVDAVAGRLRDQITQTVRWRETLDLALRAGFSELWEIGPGSVLSGLAKKHSTQFKCRQFSTLKDLEVYEANVE